MFQSAQKGFTSLSLVILRDLLLSTIFAYILGILLNFGVYGIYVGIILGWLYLPYLVISTLIGI